MANIYKTVDKVAPERRNLLDYFSRTERNISLDQSEVPVPIHTNTVKEQWIDNEVDMKQELQLESQCNIVHPECVDTNAVEHAIASPKHSDYLTHDGNVMPHDECDQKYNNDLILLSSECDMPLECEDSERLRRSSRLKLRSKKYRRRRSVYIDSSDFEDKSDSSKGKRKKTKRASKDKSVLEYFKVKHKDEIVSENSKSTSKKLKLDAATAHFLKSGVPDVIIQTQNVRKREKEADLARQGFHHFPRITSIGHLPNPERFQVWEPTVKIHPSKQVPTLCLNSRITHSLRMSLSNFESIKSTGRNNLMPYHCEQKCQNLQLDLSPIFPTSPIPWIDRYKANHRKHLVVCADGLQTLRDWLKKWKKDITDNRGSNRKSIDQRKKLNSELDFLTSDEDSDHQHKFVFLQGPSGCGKTASVCLLAESLGFKVVELNFSSKRSGKNVLQQVEESVSSQNVDSSKSVLLLIEDVDLIDEAEDEGFYTSIVQLIKASLRPIVMTSNQNISFISDGKIEKNNPLIISFEPFKDSKTIISSILLPILKKENRTEVDQEKAWSLFDSIIRHNHFDIRRVIHQSQFLCTVPSVSTTYLYEQLPSPIDFDFVHSLPKKRTRPEDKEPSFYQERNTEALKHISVGLSLICELEVSFQQMKNIDSKTRTLLKEIYNHLFRLYLNSYSGPDGFAQFLGEATLDGEDDLNLKSATIAMHGQMKEYINLDWENAAGFRTIIKSSALSSLGRMEKRNGRLSCYFSRLRQDLVQKIIHTFGFAKELEMTRVKYSKLIL